MRSGLYRHYADIEELVITGTGDRGQPIPSWQPLYRSLPMSIDSMSGRELELSRQLVATASHKIGLRYQSGITPAMRVNFGGRLFNIGYVNEYDFRNRYLQLICTEKVGE